MLAILLAVATGLFIKERVALLSAKTQLGNLVEKNKFPAAGPEARGAANRPMMIGKGTDLKTTPLFKFVHELAPTASSDAKKALVGWNVTTTKQSDGSMLVTLTPKDAEDQSQQYTLKSGQVLYFVEQTMGDDNAGSDKDLNYRDDYGIITDQNGIIQ